MFIIKTSANVLGAVASVFNNVNKSRKCIYIPKAHFPITCLTLVCTSTVPPIILKF